MASPDVSNGDQAEVIAFLKSPATHGSDNKVEVIETHGALVFLAGDAAFKIKRAVKYDYLDFSTLKRRERMLKREVELNAPAAPQIYRDVVPVTRDPDGGLELAGRGKVVEWVLRMRRFAADDELWNIALAGKLTDDRAEALGRSIAQYHDRAGRRRKWDGASLIGEIVEELRQAFSEHAKALGVTDVQAYAKALSKTYEALRPALSARTKTGAVRRCHGDLHLRNIVLLNGTPVPFDALEFDEKLGTCDVLYDLAFLIMDLCHQGLPHAANLVFNSYLGETRDVTGIVALPLFLSIRAAIRAMVDVQTACFTGAEDNRREARIYLQNAMDYLSPPPPQLLAIGGLSGSGKTTLAKVLAHEIGAVPGAVHLRSDLERKAMFGVGPLERLPPKAYSSAKGAQVYARLRDAAARVLATGHSVIVDAVHLAPAERRAIEAVAEAAGVRFTGLWFTASEDTLIARVGARFGDASDADADVVAGQLRRETGALNWTQIRTDGDLAITAAKVRKTMAQS